MCGIVGMMVFERRPGGVSHRFLKAMADSIAHRGPDGEGFWIREDESVGLGHRRLAIVDLSELANQPMQTADGRYRLVFNGEIYNHAEIRAELDNLRQIPWRTDHSDSEALLYAFDTWGIGCFEKLRGMFAFAIWDEKEREMWLVRDRLGIKPLYWTQHQGRLLFGSEIKALLQDPELCRIVNEEALAHYMTALTTPAPQTLFKGIYKLPPSTWMRVSADGNVRQHRYWDPLERAQPILGKSDLEIAEMVQDELRRAVQLRKVSDVPVGVFLSGGIDSSTNAVLFSEGETNPVKTFSIGYDGDYASYPSELPYARQAAEWCGAEHHERILSMDDLLDFLPQMIQLQDEPIADPVCVPVYYVSKLARDNGVIVAQVGEGADELFCGYGGWKAVLALERLNRLPFPRFGKKMALAALDGLGKQRRPYRERLRRACDGKPLFWGGAEAFSSFEKSELLAPRFTDINFWSHLEPIWESFQEKAWERTPLNWMTYLDLNLRLPELLLMRVDKMSMGVSLEARVPFLDHKFVELAMSIPADVKFRDREQKAILKKAVKGLIPDEILNRKKQGFGVPLYEWFFDRLGEQASADLRKFCSETDYFQKEAVEGLLERKEAKQVWYLWNFALWHRQFIEA